MSNNPESSEGAIGTIPLVSVVIPVYNAAKFLRETLESIVCQTYRRMEIIAVNDGSTDLSRKILQEYSDRIQCIDQRNHGVAVARNVGVSHSQGSYIAFCDADDVWFPRKLEWQMEIAIKHPGVGVIGGLMEEIDEFGRTFKARQCPLDLYDKPINLKQVFLMEGNVDGVSMSTSVIKKNIFEKIQGFETEHTNLKAEDYDLWIRASGETQFYMPSKNVARYRVLKSSRSHGNLRKEYEGQFQLLRIYRKEYSAEKYKIRKAKIYAEWAESSFFEGEDLAWRLQAKAIKLHPTHRSYHIRLIREIVKKFLKRSFRNLPENVGVHKENR